MPAILKSVQQQFQCRIASEKIVHLFIGAKFQSNTSTQDKNQYDQSLSISIYKLMWQERDINLCRHYEFCKDYKISTQLCLLVQAQFLLK
uniref:Uncharacterized protein n=1 Tax=Rhizophora mucronata TaxID=61149 RepID=A0A2P2NIT3_RHIMU